MSIMKALQIPHDIRLSVNRTGIVFVSSASLLVLALSLWSKMTLRKRKLRQDVNKLAGVRKLADLPKGFEDLDEEAEYDYIVVGGGTAGCAMASRLSEDPNIRVLLLEAGPSSLDEPLVNIPPGAVELFRDKRVSFDLYTTEQKHADGRKRFWPRGKMLGGCSAINAMMFHGGAPSDYDEWVRQGGPGAEQWSFKNLFPYFLKFESFVPHPEFAGVDTSVRGSSGPVKIGYFGHFSAISRRFLSACGNAGIPLVPDVNTPNGPWLGATKIMTFIDKSGRRVTTESSYLTNDVLKRKNLTVAIRVGVTRVLFSNGNLTKKEGSLGLGASEPEPRAVGVEFAKEDKKEERFVVRASKEVILCAGAVHTPHILLLSGIGPSNELAQFSPEIPLVCDLDGVGKHLQDHLVVHLRYRVGKEAGSLNWIGGDKSNRESMYPGNGKAVANGHANGNGYTNGYVNGHTNGHANGNGTAKISVVATKQKSIGPSTLDKAVMKLRFAGAMVRWLFGFRGALTCNVCEAVAFVRSTDVFPAISPSSVSSSIEALANHPGAPDLELMSSPLAWTEHGAGPIPSGDLVSLSVVHLRPTSMGEVKLRSADAWDEPEIDPNYLSTQNDVDTLARGVAILLKITRTEPLATILDNGNSDPNSKPTPNDPLLPTDSNSLEHLLDHSLHLQPTTILQNFIKARAETLYHPTSTARMAPRSEGGVVDTSLRVYGVKGLRIVDASVFPTIVSGHTASPVLAVAEKAAEMVKQSFYDDN